MIQWRFGKGVLPNPTSKSGCWSMKISHTFGNSSHFSVYRLHLFIFFFHCSFGWVCRLMTRAWDNPLLMDCPLIGGLICESSVTNILARPVDRMARLDSRIQEHLSQERRYGTWPSQTLQMKSLCLRNMYNTFTYYTFAKKIACM